MDGLLEDPPQHRLRSPAQDRADASLLQRCERRLAHQVAAAGCLRGAHCFDEPVHGHEPAEHGEAAQGAGVQTLHLAGRRPTVGAHAEEVLRDPRLIVGIETGQVGGGRTTLPVVLEQREAVVPVGQFADVFADRGDRLVHGVVDSLRLRSFEPAGLRVVAHPPLQCPGQPVDPGLDHGLGEDMAGGGFAGAAVDGAQDDEVLLRAGHRREFLGGPVVECLT
ncbi:hypothetical protein AB0I68_16720 [Streptomyces sp. NPDC050448]|uniref:hypothetical protein n=1 Tax=Streptomyces sp. NPDC050448 TaxID=3155404 RepID=UPI00343FA2F7